jgi:predicted DNA-binding transcriptional regulator YafY
MAPKLLHQIDELLRALGKRYSAEALAEKLGISKRYVIASIEQLHRDHHAPISRRSRQGYYYTDPIFALKRLLLTPHELQSVRRALLAAQEFGGVGVEESWACSRTHSLVSKHFLQPTLVFWVRSMRLQESRWLLPCSMPLKKHGAGVGVYKWSTGRPTIMVCHAL